MKFLLRTFVSGCVLLALACNSDGGRAAGPEPLGPSAATQDTFVVAGKLSGRLVGTGLTGKDARVFTYGHFEGDSAGRIVGPTTSAGDSGRFSVSLFDRAVVAADTQSSRRQPRRWRALVVAFPVVGPGAGVTLGATEWITRAAGDTMPVALHLDISLLARGVLPDHLPVPVPTGLPTRPGAADVSAVTDSVRRLGAEVFVRVTGSPSPAALVLLATAGLHFPDGHGAFPHFQSFDAYTVWGHLPASSGTDVLGRLERLPFLTAIELLETRVGDMPVRSLPTRDSHPVSASDERTFVYDQSTRCFVDIASVDQAAPVTCGTLIVGLQHGAQPAGLATVFAALSAHITRESVDPQGNVTSVTIALPTTTERRALNVLQQNQLVRYVALDYIGGLLAP